MTLQYLNANEALPNLLHRVMTQGHKVDSRNGKTLELTMQQITLAEPSLQKEITVPGRRVSLPAQIAETMWILSGRNDIDWIGHYLPRAAEFSDDNKVWRGGYGPRLRQWEYRHDGEAWASSVDQLADIINLLKADPESRRAVFTIYNPQIDNEPGKDVPCNNWVHFLPREGTLHAHVAIRSNDLFWGWSGINAFEWTSLLQVVAGLTGLEPGSVTFSISSLHLYERHWEKAKQIVENVRVQGYGSLSSFKPAPGFEYPGSTVKQLDALIEEWFRLEGQIRKGGLSSALLSQINTFPEPMFKSWLLVLLAWHHDDKEFLRAYEGTALFQAFCTSPKRKLSDTEAGNKRVLQQAGVKLVSENRDQFTTFCHELHVEKNAAYGNSWMKRGEMLGIMANCARKVDRLGVGGAGDTAADTAIDLLMYFIKYDLWLDQQKHSDWHITEGEAHVGAVHNYLQVLAGEKHLPTSTNESLISTIKSQFDELENLVTEKRANRDGAVKALIAFTYPLALRLWAKEQRDTEIKTVSTEGAAIDAWHAANATRRFDGYNIADETQLFS